MSGHTPGPWVVDGDLYIIISSECDDIGQVFTSEADARLIAAAPELLEALRPLAAVAEFRPPGARDNEAFIHWAGFAPLTWGMAQAAHAAIAKAEGRS